MAKRKKFKPRSWQIIYSLYTKKKLFNCSDFNINNIKLPKPKVIKDLEIFIADNLQGNNI